MSGRLRTFLMSVDSAKSVQPSLETSARKSAATAPSYPLRLASDSSTPRMSYRTTICDLPPHPKNLRQAAPRLPAPANETYRTRSSMSTHV